MKEIARLTTALVLLALACNVPTPTPDFALPAATQASGERSSCGDGACAGPEDTASCPADCTPIPTAAPAPPVLAEIAAGPAELDGPGYITFAINVHDIVHPGASADILLQLVDLFEYYGVRGDFYLTGPITHLYAEQRPDVIARLRDSEMTISYHIRPPHPAYNGFDLRLREMDEATLVATLREYETYRLDLATGDLLRDQPGGYTIVAKAFGRDPVVASAPSERYRDAILPILAELGARATVIYHESGTDIEEPFETWFGLLARPSDFSVTRWNAADVRNRPFWWNMLDSSLAADYNPTAYLQSQLATWHADRPPFITVLIHENNFYRRGGTPFTFVYWADLDKTQPLAPPFDLDAPDASQPRSAANQVAIWEAYEELVAFAANRLRVVTSEDILAVAGE